MANQDAAGNKKSWWDGVKAEFGKIIWPTKNDVQRETGAVLVVSIILSVIIAILDYLMQNGIDWLISL